MRISQINFLRLGFLCLEIPFCMRDQSGYDSSDCVYLKMHMRSKHEELANEFSPLGQHAVGFLCLEIPYMCSETSVDIFPMILHI